MNCHCNPPRVAAVKLCSTGDRAGQQFFCCAGNGDNKCSFFVFQGSNIPFSLNRQQVVHSANSSGSSTASAATNTAKATNSHSATGTYSVKFKLSRIKENPTYRVWVMALSSSYSPLMSKMTQLYMSFPKEYRIFAGDTKLWSFDFEIYPQLIARLKSSEFGFVKLEELPPYLTNILTKFLQQQQQLPQPYVQQPLHIDPHFLSQLKPFQIEGIQFVIKRNGRALIADEMGCGKTVQAIGLIQHYRTSHPVLILVQPNLIHQWREEILKFAGSMFKAKDIQIPKTANDVISGTAVSIVPFSLLAALVEKKHISPAQFGMVVVDESHNLKNMETQKTMAALPFLKAAPIALCLSGTPATNRPAELYSQLHGLLPEVFSDKDGFEVRYCDQKPSRFDPRVKEAKGCTNQEELNTLLCSMVMIRRLKDDVVTLPPKERQLRRVKPDSAWVPELTALQRELKQIDDRMNADPDNIYVLKAQRQTAMAQYHKITGKSKITAIREELTALLEESRAARSRAEMEADATYAAASSSSAATIAYDSIRKDSNNGNGNGSRGGVVDLVMTVDEDETTAGAGGTSDNVSLNHLPHLKSGKCVASVIDLLGEDAPDDGTGISPSIAPSKSKSTLSPAKYNEYTNKSNSISVPPKAVKCCARDVIIMELEEDICMEDKMKKPQTTPDSPEKADECIDYDIWEVLDSQEEDKGEEEVCNGGGAAASAARKKLRKMNDLRPVGGQSAGWSKSSAMEDALVANGYEDCFDDGNNDDDFRLISGKFCGGGGDNDDDDDDDSQAFPAVRKAASTVTISPKKASVGRKRKKQLPSGNAQAEELELSSLSQEEEAVKVSERRRGLGRKIVLFGHHIDVLDAIQACCEDLNVGTKSPVQLSKFCVE